MAQRVKSKRAPATRKTAHARRRSSSRTATRRNSGLLKLAYREVLIMLGSIRIRPSLGLFGIGGAMLIWQVTEVALTEKARSLTGVGVAGLILILLGLGALLLEAAGFRDAPIKRTRRKS